VPEILEIEYYRKLAVGALDREIAAVKVPDPHCLVADLSARDLGRILKGASFRTARRRGKLLMLDTAETTLAIRFGMTGSLALDGKKAIEKLRYAPKENSDRWLRFVVSFKDGGALNLHDQRRFGRVSLNPDLDELGPDALSVTKGQLVAALAARGAGPPLKARLQDQAHLAGLGNLLVDEILWRASLSPLRGSTSLDPTETARLHRQVRAVLDQLMTRGGSHLGDLMEERHPGGRCPKDGAELLRQQVGGRTTYWCPEHQH
jgi:formamidopyrimidine-DNA glycosylase